MKVAPAIKYYLFSRHRTGRGIHSPFLYELIRKVFMASSGRGAYGQGREQEDLELIQGIRKELLRNKSLLVYDDPGMGHSGAGGSDSRDMQAGRTVRKLAKDAAVKRKYGKLLYKLAGRFGGENMLELGTNLGIGSLFLAKGAANAGADGLKQKASTLHTIEAAEPVLELARGSFKKAGVNNIKTYLGTFAGKLPEILGNISSLDLVYFDGDHNGRNTIGYFETCLEKAGSDSLFIFDDIHWSDDMEVAWKEIISRKEVRLSLDLLQMGLVFFREGVAKQHFVIRF